MGDNVAEGASEGRASGSTPCRVAAGMARPLTRVPDGLPAAAVEPWQQLVHAYVRHAADVPERLAAFEAAAPEHPLAPAARGLLLMGLARSELAEPARAALAEARRRLAGGAGGERPADPFCRAVVGALADLTAGAFGRAAGQVDRILPLVPDDLFAIKMVHAIRFMAGDPAGMRRSLETAPANGMTTERAAGYRLGCYAFALEETGDTGRAEAAGRMALELAPDDAWGLHAVAHVYEAQMRPVCGIDWLARHRSAFAHCNNFRFHVHWHEALFELERSNTGRVLELYDSAIRFERTDDFRDIANGASMLARLALEEVDVGDRWEELADLAEARIADGTLVFADLHYQIALSASGREEAADTLAGRMGNAPRPREGHSEQARVAATIGADAAAGIAEFYRGQHLAAFRRLDRAVERLVAVGGSHAQRDVFEQITIEAALSAGLPCEAQRRISRRARRQGGLDRFGRTRFARAEALSGGIPGARPRRRSVDGSGLRG